MLLTHASVLYSGARPNSDWMLGAEAKIDVVVREEMIS